MSGDKSSEKIVNKKTYKKFPVSIVLLFNGMTVLYYLLGGFGMMLGYNFSWVGNVLSYLYIIFAFGQMYLFLPFFVCPNCVYFHLNGSRCMLALNLFSRKIAKPGEKKNFFKRKEGLFCSNNLNIVALFIPVLVMIHALIFNFSLWLLLVFLFLIMALALRTFFVLPNLICEYCLSREICPNIGKDSVIESKI